MKKLAIPFLLVFCGAAAELSFGFRRIDFGPDCPPCHRAIPIFNNCQDGPPICQPGFQGYRCEPIFGCEETPIEEELGGGDPGTGGDPGSGGSGETSPGGMPGGEIATSITDNCDYMANTTVSADDCPLQNGEPIYGQHCIDVISNQIQCGNLNTTWNNPAIIAERIAACCE